MPPNYTESLSISIPRRDRDGLGLRSSVLLRYGACARIIDARARKNVIDEGNGLIFTASAPGRDIRDKPINDYQYR